MLYQHTTRYCKLFSYHVVLIKGVPYRRAPAACSPGEKALVQCRATANDLGSITPYLICRHQLVAHFCRMPTRIQQLQVTWNLLEPKPTFDIQDPVFLYLTTHGPNLSYCCRLRCRRCAIYPSNQLYVFSSLLGFRVLACNQK